MNATDGSRPAPAPAQKDAVNTAEIRVRRIHFKGGETRSKSKRTRQRSHGSGETHRAQVAAILENLSTESRQPVAQIDALQSMFCGRLDIRFEDGKAIVTPSVEDDEELCDFMSKSALFNPRKKYPN